MVMLFSVLQILQVNKDLYYTRFLVHYLGWTNRYDEWIAEEVIYSVVDRSQPNFNVRSLKVRYRNLFEPTCPISDSYPIYSPILFMAWDHIFYQ